LCRLRFNSKKGENR